MKFLIQLSKNSKYETFKSTIRLMTDEWKYRFCCSHPKTVSLLKNKLEEVLNRKINIGDDFETYIDINKISETIELVQAIQEKQRQPMYKDFRDAVSGGRKFVIVTN